MRWFIKKEFEDEKSIVIAYSFEESADCDGKIEYIKKTEQLNIKNLSKSANEFNTKRLFPHIYRLIEEGSLSYEMRVIAIG